MNSMSGKLGYTLWPFFLLLLTVGSAYTEFDPGIWGFGIFTGIVMIWIVGSDWYASAHMFVIAKTELVKQRTDFGRMLGSLSPDRYSALGLEFPELDIAFEGTPIVRLRNTNILLDCFQKFLVDSTDVNFASLNWYNEDKSLQERFDMSRDAVRAQWHLAVNYLAEAGHITKNSAAGNHSYVWMKGSRAKLTRWYGMVSAVDYVNMNTEVPNDLQ
jgi:hypothetical protein